MIDHKIQIRKQICCTDNVKWSCMTGGSWEVKHNHTKIEPQPIAHICERHINTTSTGMITPTYPLLSGMLFHHKIIFAS